jgi:hypothetical protein
MENLRGARRQKAQNFCVCCGCKWYATTHEPKERKRSGIKKPLVSNTYTSALDEDMMSRPEIAAIK